MKTFSELRAEWIAAGTPWNGSPEIPRPVDWNPEQQLQKLLGFNQKSRTRPSRGTVRNRMVDVHERVSASITVGTRDYVYGVTALNLGVRPAEL
jgi:hypothetical protein